LIIFTILGILEQLLRVLEQLLRIVEQLLRIVEQSLRIVEQLLRIGVCNSLYHKELQAPNILIKDYKRQISCGNCA
jgi:hypothetical protein